MGIGYDDSITRALELIAQVLDDLPAVLKTPEPMVLVEKLGAATINLRGGSPSYRLKALPVSTISDDFLYIEQENSTQRRKD